MKRLTTPTHRFELPFSTDTLEKIKITYMQGTRMVLTKYKEDCTLDGNIIKCVLTQEDTQKFSNDNVKIRIRVKTIGGEVFASNILTVFCEDIFDEEVL